MNSPLQQDNWSGRSIGDRQRYRLDKRIGSGGMGDVFIAMDTLLGQQVALNLIKDTLLGSKSLRKRFEREVALCAALKSDHIVNVSDYGVTDEGHPFYVMEYLRGQSLGELLRQQQRLDVKQSVNIVTQVCDGLCKAHEGVTLWQNGATASKQIKVIHRDLKPDNIFLVPTVLGELVKILDFGIAKIRNESPEYTNLTSMFVGTFHYAAPEQFEVEATIDERTDIYSLGIILYEMLSGTDPFGLGLNIHQQMISGMSWVLAHASKPPVPLKLHKSCEQVLPGLEAAVMRCLQKSPDERFASVGELKLALQVAVEPRDSTRTFPPLSHSQSEETIPQTPNPSRQGIPEVTITHISPSPGAGFDQNTTNSSLTPSVAGFSEALLSPAQSALLKIFREFVGPIGATLFQQVLTKASGTQELVESLALYLAPHQRSEFEKKARSLHREPAVQPQTSSDNSFSLHAPAINASFIHQCERDLVELIGPIGTFLVQKVLKSHPQISATELVKILAADISDPKKAADFCQRLLK